VVIDSNRLNSDELRMFLTMSAENKAVITDYAWMEAYKHGSPESVVRSFRVLSDFPEQVILLKGTKAVGALDARAPGIANRMIVPRSVREFTNTVKGLRQASKGDRGVIAQIRDHQLAAQEQMAKALADAAELIPILSENAKNLFTQEEISRFRNGKSYSLKTGDTIVNAAEHMSRGFFKRHPEHPRLPSRNSLVNTFLYRYALASILHLIEWIRCGSQTEISAEKIRNDLVDLNFAVYGSYFNGLMTADSKLSRRHGELRHVLRILGGRMPDEYLDSFLDELKAAAA
jgi:hypothetical protein